MSVYICKAFATCDDCDVTYGSNNAMGLMARHCKKMGHSGQVSMEYAINMDRSKKEKKDA